MFWTLLRASKRRMWIISLQRSLTHLKSEVDFVSRGILLVSSFTLLCNISWKVSSPASLKDYTSSHLKDWKYLLLWEDFRRLSLASPIYKYLWCFSTYQLSLNANFWAYEGAQTLRLSSSLWEWDGTFQKLFCGPLLPPWMFSSAHRAVLSFPESCYDFSKGDWSIFPGNRICWKPLVCLH